MIDEKDYDTMNRAYFLDKAEELINGQRAKDYGDAKATTTVSLKCGRLYLEWR